MLKVSANEVFPYQYGNNNNNNNNNDDKDDTIIYGKPAKIKQNRCDGFMFS